MSYSRGYPGTDGTVKQNTPARVIEMPLRANVDEMTPRSRICARIVSFPSGMAAKKIRRIRPSPERHLLELSAALSICARPPSLE